MFHSYSLYKGDIMRNGIRLPQTRILVLSLFCCIGFTCDFDQELVDYQHYFLNFDGINDRVVVEVPDLSMNSISEQITIECWVFPRSYPNRAPRIVDRSDNKEGIGTGDRFLLHLFEPDSAARMNINGSGLSSEKIKLNRWTHIAGTYDGVELRLYVDGSLSDSIQLVTAIAVQDSMLYIGNDSNLTQRQFDGYIDEVRIWSVAKSQTEIQNNMNNILGGNERNLVAYWRMDEGQGQQIRDSAGNNNGILGLGGTSDASDAEWLGGNFPPN